MDMKAWKREIGYRRAPRSESRLSRSSVSASDISLLAKELAGLQKKLRELVSEFERQSKIIRESPVLQRRAQEAEMLRAGDTLGLIKAAHQQPSRPNWLACR